MLHPSRIFALLLTLSLLSFAAATYYPLPVMPSALSYIYLAAGLLVFWKIKIIRYTLLIIVFAVFPFLRVADFIEPIAQEAGEFRAVVNGNSGTIGNQQKFTVRSLETEAKYEVVTNQFPKYSFGDFLFIRGEVKAGDGGYHRARGLKGRINFPKNIERIAPVYRNDWDRSFINLQKSLIGWRGRIEENISNSIPEPESGLLSGILLGTRANLPTSFISDLSKTGTIHIIALSGFNITILAEFLRIVTRKLSKKVALFAPLAGIWIFVLATSQTASVVRAAIMGSLLVFAGGIGRRSDSLVAILFAAFVMVWLNPYILLNDIGFQLSFAAAFGILFLAPAISTYFNFLGSSLSQMAAATISAQLLTWPLTSYYFGAVSIIAPLANLFVLPFIPLVMLAGFAVAILGFFSLWLSRLFGLLLWAALGYVVKIISVFAGFGFSAVSIKLTSVPIILGYYLIIIDIVIFLRGAKVAKKFI